MPTNIIHATDTAKLLKLLSESKIESVDIALLPAIQDEAHKKSIFEVIKKMVMSDLKHDQILIRLKVNK